MLKSNTINFSKDIRFLTDLKTEKLETSELRYRRLFETAQDGILILDGASGKITDANPFLKNLLGYPDSELLGKQLWEIGVFKDIVDSKKAFLELQNEGYIRYEDLPLHTKNGQSIDVEFVSNVYMVDNQRVIQCNIRDITDRKRAEAAVASRTKELEILSKSQEETKKALLNVMEDFAQAKTIIEFEKAKDEAMLASIGDGLIALDNDLKILIFNKSAEQMLGLKRLDMIGQDISVCPLEDEFGHRLLRNQRPTYKALISGKEINNVFYFVKKDKTRFPIAISITPIKLAGKIIGVLAVFRDITKEREIDRAKSEFVSLASHQLRTPLGISKWYLEALKEEGFLVGISDRAKDYLSEVYKSNERLLSLVRGLLSVSRIDQGKVKDSPQMVNISGIVKVVIREMKLIAVKNKITIHLKQKKTNIPRISLDPLRMQEALENLITNAIVYSQPLGRVEIMIDKKDQFIVISILDSGIGISADDQKKLFTRFFRSTKATAKNIEGAGLGLYVVKSYVERWGGSITVDSVEDVGSTFIISIPIKKSIEVSE